MEPDREARQRVRHRDLVTARRQQHDCAECLLQRIGGRLGAGPQRVLRHALHLEGPAPDLFEGPDDLMRAHGRGAAELQDDVVVRAVVNRSRCELRHVAERDPADLLFPGSVDRRPGILVVEAGGWAEPDLHEGSGAQDRVRHPALAHAALNRQLGRVQRVIFTGGTRDRDVDESRDAGSAGGIDEIQLSLPVHGLE
jgi:hypothetical protein